MRKRGREEERAASMRTEHNNTWRRWFILKFCRMGPAWVPSSLKQGLALRDLTSQSQVWGREEY